MDTQNTLENTIDRAAWRLVSEAKNATALNLTTAAASKQLQIEPALLQQVLALISSSIDAGYSQGARVFSRTVKEALQAHGTQKKTR